MKKILLVGSAEGSGAALEQIIDTDKFKIHHAHSADKAIELLRTKHPDYILCSGTIQEDGNGNYFIEV